MKTLCRTLSLLLLVCLSACSEKLNKPATSPTATPSTAPAAAPTHAQTQTVADLPPKLRDDCEAFAKQLEQDMRQGQVKAVREAFNRQAIVDGIMAGVRLPAAQLSEFKRGLMLGASSSVSQIAEVWSKEEAKFKHLVIYKDGPAARFRLAGEGTGVAIIDLALGKDARGKVGIVGFFNHAMGYDMVEQTRQVAAPMLAEMDKSFLERLIGQPNVRPEDFQAFGELPRKLAKRDFAGVIAGYKALTPQLRESLPATAMNITALHQIGDQKAYKAALQDAARRFKTVNFQFMLVDAYFIDKQYDKAAECIDNFMHALEKDAVLLTLKSLMQNAGGHVTEARATLQEALKLEPDCKYVHAKGLDVLLVAKDYAAVRDSMIFLEEHAGYHFKGGLTDPVWKDFMAAPESARWR